MAGAQAVETYKEWQKDPEAYYEQWNLDEKWAEAQRVAGVDNSIEGSARNIDKAIEQSLPQMDEKSATDLITIMKNGAEQRVNIEYTQESWEKLFPENIVWTPFGQVKMGENQYAKFGNKKR